MDTQNNTSTDAADAQTVIAVEGDEACLSSIKSGETHMIARAATRTNLIAAKEDYNAELEAYTTICDNTDDRRTIGEALNVLLAASRRLTRAEIADDDANEQVSKS